MELQPCPFCAGKAEFNQTEDGGHFIECTSCRSSTNLRYSLMEDAKPILAEGWNRRAQTAAPVAAQEPIAYVTASCDTDSIINHSLPVGMGVYAAPVATQEPVQTTEQIAHMVATAPAQSERQPVGWRYGNSFWQSDNPSTPENAKKLGKALFWGRPTERN